MVYIDPSQPIQLGARGVFPFWANHMTQAQWQFVDTKSSHRLYCQVPALSQPQPRDRN